MWKRIRAATSAPSASGNTLRATSVKTAESQKPIHPFLSELTAARSLPNESAHRRPGLATSHRKAPSTCLNNVLLIRRDQALEHRDLAADGVTAFRLSDASQRGKLLDLLHGWNDVSALG